MTITGAPTTPPPISPSPKVKWKTWEKVAVAVVGLAIIGGAAATLETPKDDGSSPGSGSFYAAPGWTIDRVVDFELDLNRNAGWSMARARCAAKDVAGNFTWYVWSDMTKTGKLVAAEMADC